MEDDKVAFNETKTKSRLLLITVVSRNRPLFEYYCHNLLIKSFPNIFRKLLTSGLHTITVLSPPSVKANHKHKGKRKGQKVIAAQHHSIKLTKLDMGFDDSDRMVPGRRRMHPPPPMSISSGYRTRKSNSSHHKHYG